MSNQTIQIASRHSSLSEAFEKAVSDGILDIQYNPAAAREKVKLSERPHHGFQSREAFISDSGDIYYIYDCDILILNKFDPFIGVIDSIPFRLALLGETEIEIIEGISIPKNKVGRKALRELNNINPKLVAF